MRIPLLRLSLHDQQTAAFQRPLFLDRLPPLFPLLLFLSMIQLLSAPNETVTITLFSRLSE